MKAELEAKIKELGDRLEKYSSTRDGQEAISLLWKADRWIDGAIEALDECEGMLDVLEAGTRYSTQANLALDEHDLRNLYKE